MSAGDRRAELVAGAVAGDLDVGEEAELDELRRRDPGVDAEIAELRALATRTSDALPRWDAREPSAGLRGRVIGIGAETSVSGATPTARASTAISVEGAGGERRRRRTLVGLTAAACLVAGAALGGVAVGVATGRDGAPAGPPGTLGAVEQVDFTGEPGGVEVDGAVVAHTWGTETVLHVAGLPAGDTYSVVLVEADGTRVDSGAFLGSTVEIDCRMNAAVLRPDVESVEIERADGSLVAAADLPAA